MLPTNCKRKEDRSLLDEQVVLEKLIDPERGVEEKSQTLLSHFNSYQTMVGHMGTGICYGRELALSRLLDIVPEEQRSQLKGAISAVGKHWAPNGAGRPSNPDAAGAHLRALNPGTPIVISINGSEEVVEFLKMKRTRFVCQHPDGRQYSVPTQLFLHEVD